MAAINVIEQAGLPIPPKSACWFCPFASRSVWIERKKHEPELYAAALQMERDINAHYQSFRGDHPKASKFIALHRDGISLADVPD